LNATENYTEILNSNSTLSALNSSDAVHNLVKRATISQQLVHEDCQRTNIMGSLVQNASPFLFPCTIEYSLVCACILFEMWKSVKSIPNINKTRKSSLKVTHGHTHGHSHDGHHKHSTPYHFSIDCSKAQRGMFAGIVVIVLTIISLIMYFVLHDIDEYLQLAIKEVTYYEILLYTVTTIAVLVAFQRMKDLKYHKPPAHGRFLRKVLIMKNNHKF
jgi:hypothetical protein